MNPMDKVRRAQLRENLPAFKPGDSVRVHVKIREGDKERIQPFEGTVIARRGTLSQETFTVRKVSFGLGVERIFPLHSPVIDQIEILKPGRVRRAKLYYLGGRKGKAARIRAEKEKETVAKES